MHKITLACLSLLCGLLISTSPLYAKAYADSITVAKDGSGDYTSIQKAIEATKSFPYKRITIYVKNGAYHEKVFIPEWNTRVSLIGQSKDSTIITFGDYFNKIDKGPNSTFYTATLLVQGNDFHAENLTIENSAGPVGQAIALAVEADRCSFVNCRFLGNQDTLYDSGEKARQYFRDCYIEGTTDFIFGEATAVFDSCELKIKSDSYYTAASTNPGKGFGFVFMNCKLTAAPGVQKVFLGRPWRTYAKTVYLNCWMNGAVRPEGWYNWNNKEAEQKALYAEYQTKGPGANPQKRVAWSKQLTPAQAKRYTLENIFRIETDDWNPLKDLND